MLRQKIFHLVNVTDEESTPSKVYDGIMITAIVVSLLPLCFKEDYPVFDVSDAVLLCLFILDYGLRWLTADFKMKRGPLSFLIYPFTPMAIVDLVSLLPFLLPLNSSLRTLRLIRLFPALRAIRFLRQSKSFQVVCRVIENQKSLLLMVAGFALIYILACALVIFNVEPATFDNFFDAIYWSCISLLTVGYGDIYPHTDLGRFVAMVSSFVGVALIALPSGIITGGFIDEMKEQ